MTQLWEIKIVVTSHVSHHHTLGYRLDLQRRRKKKKRILPTTFVLKTDKENNWTLRRFLGHSETQSAVCRFHVHVCTVSHGCYFAGVGCKTIFWQCVGLRGCHIPCNLSQIPSPHTHTQLFLAMVHQRKQPHCAFVFCFLVRLAFISLHF